MSQYCFKCGHSVREGEGFCEKCGAKLTSNEGSQNQYDAQGPLYNENQYINNMKRSNIEKVTSKSLKFAVIMTVAAGICALIIGAIVLIGVFGPDDPPNNNVIPSNNNTIPSNNNTTPNNNKITPDNNTTPSNNNTTPGKTTTLWSADLNSYATYNESKKQINIDYSVTLKNNGTTTATDVKVYLDPKQNDENAAYLGISPKTIVNIDENIPSINAGITREIKTYFYYDNVQPANVTQQLLQDVANRYVKIPILVEWKENGKVFTQSLTIQ